MKYHTTHVPLLYYSADDNNDDLIFVSTVIGGAIGGVLLLIMIVLLVLIVAVLYIRKSQIKQKYSVNVEANSDGSDSEYTTCKVLCTACVTSCYVSYKTMYSCNNASFAHIQLTNFWSATASNNDQSIN